MAVALVGCGSDTLPGATAKDHRPRRIVSLDFCADQYVLKFAERDRILALSPDAGREYSYLRGQAAGLATVRPAAENVIALAPDLVVRSYGGGPRAASMFERAGIAVHNIERAENMESILRAVTGTAHALGSAERGRAIAEEMRGRLMALRPQAADAGVQSPDPNAQSADVATGDRAPIISAAAAGAGDRPVNAGAPSTPVSALYMTPGGVTTGPGSLIHEILTAAGLENFQTRPGWGPIPLERLAYEQPDLIAAAFQEDLENHPHAWSAIRHPVARAQLDGGAVVPLDGAWTACGAWFALDAAEALARDPAASQE